MKRLAQRLATHLAPLVFVACSSATTPLAGEPVVSDTPEVDAGNETMDAAGRPIPGVLAEYFPDFTQKPLTRVEPAVDHVWGDAAPSSGVDADHFSARFSATLTPPKSGKYKIAVESDDGVRLWLDDTLIIENYDGHFVERDEKEVDLVEQKPVKLILDYFELDLKAQVRLLWSSDTMAEEPISSRYLTTLPSSGKAGPIPPYVNPILGRDCPDPGVLRDNGPTYYMTCTGGAFPIRSSRNLLFWQDTGDAILPAGKPSWAANGGRNWAPEIHRVGNGFVAYYTSVTSADKLCIGASSAATPLGPYREQAQPLVQHADGVIDAHEFEDTDGTRWLFFKNDGNAFTPPRPTIIYAQQLAADGLSFAAGSSAKEVLRNDSGTWEGFVIEAPWVIKRGNYYYLFYSGNVYDARYRTGVARATKVTGPYSKFGSPILANNERWEGPGHGSVVTVSDLDYFVYHAYPKGVGQRQVLLDRIDWKDGWPRIHDGTPSRTSQPGPGALR